MRLERSRADSRLFGLCGGISERTGVSAFSVRLTFVIGGILTGGVLFGMYIIASMLIPKQARYEGGNYWYIPSSSVYGFGSLGAGLKTANAGAEAPTGSSFASQSDVSPLKSTL